MTMTPLLQTLTRLSKQAGDITLKHFQTNLAVETKADQSPVTIADRETEEFLRREIIRNFPDDTIVGEEFGVTDGAAGQRRWIIDPIDGTKTFVHGVPLYGVMIGVEQNGEMIAGAVNIPAIGDLVVAKKGSGCWWNGREAHVSPTGKLADALLLTTDIVSNYKQGKGDSWESLLAASRMARTWGDCYGHILVATGRADVMVDPIMGDWDCAALQVILEEAGGTFTDYDGKATIYGKCAISTNGYLFNEVMGLVKK